MLNLTMKNGRLVTIRFQFRSPALAWSFADGCERPMFVVLGCNGMHWIVSGADAQRLEKNGYELACR